MSADGDLSSPAPNAPGGNVDDKQIDLAISNILRTGVIASSLVVIAGALLYFSQHSSEKPDYQVFHSQPASLNTFNGIMDLVMHGNGEGIMQAGVILLLLTPLIRVIFSIFAFMKQRDWTYVGLTLVVLAVLVYSLMGAKIGGG